MEQTDTSAYDDKYPLNRRGDWLLDGLGRHDPCGWLTPGTSVRVLINRNDQEELWVGDVESGTDIGCLLRLWGSGKLLPVAFCCVIRAGVVPRHTHAEYRQVAALQRRGLPALVRGAQPVVELGMAMAARVAAYGAARGLSVGQATEMLLGIGLGRLAALERHALKRRRAASAKRCQCFDDSLERLSVWEVDIASPRPPYMAGRAGKPDNSEHDFYGSRGPTGEQDSSSSPSLRINLTKRRTTAANASG